MADLNALVPGQGDVDVGSHCDDKILFHLLGGNAFVAFVEGLRHLLVIMNGPLSFSLFVGGVCWTLAGFLCEQVFQFVIGILVLTGDCGEFDVLVSGAGEFLLFELEKRGKDD